ncbi:hypothetical protein QEN19_001613 [Hanseniaspora menglaensis]
MNKLSLEERLKLAASSGGKKKNRLKKNINGGESVNSSRDITPTNHQTRDNESFAEKSLEQQDTEKVIILGEENLPKEEDNELNEVNKLMTVNDQEDVNIQNIKAEPLKNVNFSDVLDKDILKQTYVATTIDEEKIERKANLIEPVSKDQENEASDFSEGKISLLVENSNNEVNFQSGLSMENFDSEKKIEDFSSIQEIKEKSEENAIKEAKESEELKPLSLSTDFCEIFNLSPIFYSNIKQSEVLFTLEKAIKEKIEDLEVGKQQEIDKLNKKNVKLNNQLVTLQKDKVKIDIKVEKLSKEIELKDNKANLSILELEKIKPKFDEINKLYIASSEKEQILAKENEELSLENKNLSAKLDDLTDNLNNYELDNDSYAARENELIEELSKMKSEHEKDIAILESKIEHQKIKFENYQLINNDDGDFEKKKEYNDIEKKLNETVIKMREQDDSWFKKYELLSNDYNYVNDTNKDLNCRNKELADNLKKTKFLLSKIELDTKVLIENNDNTLKENKRLFEELENYKNQVIQLKKDFKLMTETNKIQAKQLQEFFKEDKFHQLVSKKRKSTSLSKAPEPSKSNEDERKALALQLEDEWNFDTGNYGRQSSQLSYTSFDVVKDNDSFDETTSLISPREFTSSSQKFKTFFTSSNDIQPQLLEVDKEDPLLVRKLSAVQTATGLGNNNNNIHVISRLSSQVRKMETEITSLNQNKERLVKEKLDQQRKLYEISRELESFSNLKQVNDELIEQKSKMSARFENLEHENLLKDRRILELSEDLKDLKQMMHRQIQQMVDMQEKIL